MRQNLSNQPQLFDPNTGGVSLLALIGHTAPTPTAPAPTYPGFIWSDGNLIFSPKKTVPAVPVTEYRYTPLYRPLSSSSYDVLDLERAGKVRFVYDYSQHKYGLIVSPTPLDFGRLNDQYGQLDSDGNLVPPLEEVEEEYS